MIRLQRALTILAWVTGVASGFTVPHSNSHDVKSSSPATRLFATEQTVELRVDLPPKNSDLSAIMKVKPCLNVPSEFIEVRYSLPFELSVEPKDQLAMCTKDGKGGEKVGDVLRFTSQWTLGLPTDGNALLGTANAFAGGLKWGCTMFDVLGATDWRQVIEALTTNTPQRTDEVVLIFERALEQPAE